MEEDKFKKIIQNIGLDEPVSSFTDNVMKMIESEEELSLHPDLLPVLQNELLAEPSLEFSDNLMASIKPKTHKTLEPVINKKSWLIIGGVVISILFFAIVGFHSNLNRPHNSYFSNISLDLSGAAMRIIKIATSILPYLIPLSILLLVDYVLRTRQSNLTSREQNF